MRGSKVAVIIVVVVFLMCYGILTCHGREVSVACMMAYDEGGAPAVLNSLECPLWNFSIESSPISRDNCHFAILQGWRKYQEDRVACNLAITIPLLDNDGLIKSVTFSFAAIFDGHGGDEASELASRYFLDYFLLHVIFNNYKQAFSFHKDKETAEYDDITTAERPIHEVLEKALLKTFKDIDLEFSQKALENGYISGSTGTVAVLVDGQVLVGQVGDSKAILCSSKTNPRQDAEEGICERELYAHELTSDHHPDREDEKARIEHAGGFVSLWDVPRVNGILAMSRAIGDVQLKRYGVIADPEISRRTLNGDDSYLIVGSDGIFERLTPTDICNLLKEDCAIQDGTSSTYQNLASCPSPSLLAKRIVDAAFESGSTDNLSAILIPLQPFLS